MKLSYTIRYFLGFPIFWLVFFVVERMVFFAYHHTLYQQVAFSQMVAAFWHGLYMDVSMAAYVCVLPFLWWVFIDWVSPRIWRNVLTGYQLLLLFCFSLILATDLEIFHNWGHRIDSAIVPYLKYPKEAIASSGSAPFRILFTVFGLAFIIPSMSWAAWHVPLLNYCAISKPGLSRWMGLVLAATLIIPIRGGFQLAPMNQSAVYFSDNNRLNQAAENGVWVFIQSVLQTTEEDFGRLYMPFSTPEASQWTEPLFSDKDKPGSIWLQAPKPNIVLIIWESLTAKVTGHLDGPWPSTPNLDQLASEGIYFKNLYANGDRSDKGLASILSGIPAFGKTGIMVQPNLSYGLPHLPAELAKYGYKTSYFYGGDLGFANMKSFMLNAGFQHLVGDKDFPKEQQNSKWGAHDESVFAKELEAASKEEQPFFHTIFTLSSHEPFEIPGIQNIGNEPMDTLFCRSHRYTDRCLATWVKNARKTKWWSNSLVIVVADHGHSAPGQTAEDDPVKYHIPMVWFGPALKMGGLAIEKFGNQTDLPATVLAQLGRSGASFTFSRNLGDTTQPGSAFYAFRNGYGTIDSAGNGLIRDDYHLTDQSDTQKRIRAIRQCFYCNYFIKK